MMLTLFSTSEIVFGVDAPHLKMVAELLDQCHEALLYYGHFVHLAMVQEPALVDQCPAFATWINDFHLQPDAAFFICRTSTTQVSGLKTFQIHWLIGLGAES